MTKQQITKNQLATAYNNVGLTYAKLAKPLWARAWYELIAESEKSKYNLKQLAQPKLTSEIAGQYVRYAGQGAWHTIDLIDYRNHYKIKYFGLRMGALAMLYGPNLGEFNTIMAKYSRTAKYQFEHCQIDLKFGILNGRQVLDVTQKGIDSDCGFGFGVYADGHYIKVEQQL